MTFSKNILSNIIAPLILILICGVIIFYKFPLIPQNVSLDEAEFIRLAQSLEHSSYIPYSQLATGHATLYFYILLASIKIFGATIFAVRFPSAFFGIIDVILLYFIFKLVFEYRNKMDVTIQIGLSFVLAFVFGTMRWYFNFARFGFEATAILFFEYIGLIGYLLYRKYGHHRYLILTGICTGLAFNSYTPGRIFIILPVVMVCIDLWQRSSIKKELLTKLLYLGIPFIIIITPLSFYFTKHDDNRIYEQFFLQNEQLSVQEKASYLWQNMKSVSGMFFVKGDMNGRHNYPGKPMLNLLLGILFVIGLVISIFNWKKFPHRLFLLYFVLGILPPLLTYPWENPNALRAVTAIPAIVFFIGQTLCLVMKLPFKKLYILYAVFFIIGLSAIYEARTYFVFQSLVFPASFELHRNLLQPYLDGNYLFDPAKINKL